MKMFVQALLLIAICMSVQTSVCRAETIQNIRDEIQNGWNETYLVKGEEIVINVPIYVPSVDNIDIKRVKLIKANKDELEKTINNKDAIVENTIKSTKIINKEYEKKFGDDGFFSTAELCINNSWNVDEIELNNIYATNQLISLYQLNKEINDRIGKIYGENIKIRINKAEIKSPFYKKKGEGLFEYAELTGVGGYRIHFNEVIDGVPIISNSYIGFYTSNCDTSVGESMYFVNPKIMLSYYDKKYYMFIANNIVGEVDTIEEISDFCSFDVIKKNIEQEISNGNITNVYNLELGYIICADDNEKYSKKRGEENYILVPAWVTQCSYTGGNEPSEPNETEEAYDYETSDLDLHTLIINAYTGSIYNPNMTGDKKYYASQFMRN